MSDEATPAVEAPAKAATKTVDVQDAAPPESVIPTFDMDEIFGNTKPYEDLIAEAFPAEKESDTAEDVLDETDDVTDDEADDVEAEAAAEPLEATDDAEEKPAENPAPVAATIPDNVLSELRRRLPEKIEKIEDAYAQIDEYREQADMLAAYNSALENSPEITDVVSRILDGDDPLVAVKEVFKYAFGEPDKEEDPEAWAEWKVQDELSKKARKEAGAKARAAAERSQRMIRQAKDNYDGFVRAHQLDEAAATEHAHNFAKLFTGENGNRLRDEHDIVFKGFNHDRLLQEALDAQAAEYEAKLKTARNEGIEQANKKRKRRGDGLPAPASGRASAPGDAMDKEAARWSGEDDMSWLFKK